MKPYLNEELLAGSVIAVDMMREDFPILNPGQQLAGALRVFSRHDGERIPVVNNETERKLVGVISKTDLLLSLVEV
ncbi:MAG: CBS domain-containing protein [Methylacidiphilales bacterium]|nr:CBS domain-containing protein [Candidatus Methylacidiphilales bacterium]